MNASVRYILKDEVTRGKTFFVEGLEWGKGAVINKAYSEPGRKITRPNNGLEKGHLAPYADGIFWNWRRTTNILINVTPMWRTINGQGGNWGTLENKIRDFAGKLKRELTILSGVSGSLGHLAANNQVSVPKYLWKLVKDGNSGIVIIIRNDPSDASSMNVCTDICNQSGWNNALSDRNNAAKGRATCCNVSDPQLNRLNFPIPTVESQNIASALRYQLYPDKPFFIIEYLLKPLQRKIPHKT